MIQFRDRGTQLVVPRSADVGGKLLLPLIFSVHVSNKQRPLLLDVIELAGRI